jgi:hypothetical protein
MSEQEAYARYKTFWTEGAGKDYRINLECTKAQANQRWKRKERLHKRLDNMHFKYVKTRCRQGGNSLMWQR